MFKNGIDPPTKSYPISCPHYFLLHSLNLSSISSDKSFRQNPFPYSLWISTCALYGLPALNMACKSFSACSPSKYGGSLMLYFIVKDGNMVLPAFSSPNPEHPVIVSVGLHTFRTSVSTGSEPTGFTLGNNGRCICSFSISLVT